MIAPHVLLNPWLGRPFPIGPPLSLFTALWARVQADVEFDLRPVGFPSVVESVPAEELLLATGLAASPATLPTQFGEWGFLFEHAESLRPGPGQLRLVARAATWDSHVKGLFSDRFGMGIAAWLLWKWFDVVHVADAAAFIGRAMADPQNPYYGRGLTSLGLYGSSGRYKPDFFCLTSQNEAIIAESKAAIGPPSAVSVTERTKGKEQTRNVSPVGVRVRAGCGRVVFATNLRLENDRVRAGADTGVHIEDPEGSHDPLPVSVTADEIVIASYARLFDLCGLDPIGWALTAGFRPLVDSHAVQESSVDVEGEPVWFFGRVWGLRIGLLTRVAKPLLTASTDGIAARIREACLSSPILQRRARRQHEVPDRRRAIVLPNGTVARALPADFLG